LNKINQWSQPETTAGRSFRRLFIGSGENVTADVKQLANAFRTAKWI
jgi:hypothetical protein